MPGDSTVNQLAYLYNTFCQTLDAGKEVRVVFCDICKAFDRVWHSGLLLKLQAAGVTGEVLAWFKSYLSNRKQRVVLPGAVSDWVFIQAGVPQGSILGPLLFLLYINDIVHDIGSNIRLFADDTSLLLLKMPSQQLHVLIMILIKFLSGQLSGWLLSILLKPNRLWWYNMGQLYTVWKKRTWQNTKWGSQNNYWNNKISFNTCSLFRNTMGYSPAKTK